MTRIVVGIDPDSSKYGVAECIDGKLTRLMNLQLLEMVAFIQQTPVDLYVVEDVSANKFMYARNNKNSRGIALNIAQKVGMCKQSQLVVEQFIEQQGIEIRRVKPQAGNWADDRSLFERITGWTGQSNKDTRAAAYFAFLYCEAQTCDISQLRRRGTTPLIRRSGRSTPKKCSSKGFSSRQGGRTTGSWTTRKKP